MKHTHSASRSCGGRPRFSGRTTSGWRMPAALVAAVLAVLPAAAAPAQDASTEPAAAASAPAAPAAGAAQPEPASRPEAPPGDGPILLNFKDASVQAVLSYLSEAAGLVVLNGDRVEGRVTLQSRRPISTHEAVALLDTVLKQKGYAAIRIGRTLKIVSVAEAIRENLPVHSGSDPAEVPLTDRMVTQVIPIRYADATKLRTDLASLVGTGAMLTANKDSNSLILIDTQTNIRRIMQIIRALDEHMAGVAEVRVYPLKYADAVTTSRLITELFKQEERQRDALPAFFRFGRGRGMRGAPGAAEQETEGGRQQRVVATADERTNTLVVSAPPDMLKLIDSVVKELDSDPTEEQSVFIYPLKNAQAKNLETVLNQIFSETTTAGRAVSGRTTRTQTGRRTSFTMGRVSTPVAAAAGDLAGQVFVVADEDTNSLLVRTATKYVERVKQILAELDRAIRQVLIKVLIAEVQHDDTLDLGTEFSVLNLAIGTSGTFTLDLGGTPEEQGGGVITSTVDANLSAVFNALQRDGRVDVLSRPYILASDNKEATITIGQEVPFLRQSRTTETGQTISDIQYQDVGIILKVTPHVNPQGLVIMSVSPEISSISDTTVTVGDVQAQIYNKRSATTEVAVQNGQTIVIGGLMEDRITDVVRKVPGLGDMPGLGRLLFRRTTKVKVKTELLIFLTPRVAEQPQDLQGISKDETAGIKAVREAGGPGAFEEHMEAMRRGADTRPAAATRPAGDEHETQP